MNNMRKWVRGALLVAACVGLAWLLLAFVGDKPAGGGQGGAATGASSPDARQIVDGTMYGQALPAEGAWLGVPPSGATPAMASPLSTMTPPQFAADGKGRLVLNADTHANLEKLLLEEDPAARQATLERIASKLPAQAASELKVLLNQFQQYSKALPHTLPPDQAPQTEAEGLKLLDKLHALRVSYFGAEAAQSMFGAEEATTRQLLALMAAENDPSLSVQQKAERAQALLQQRTPADPPAK